MVPVSFIHLFTFEEVSDSIEFTENKSFLVSEARE